MATGTVTVFEKSLAKLTNGSWATTNVFKVGLTATVPTAGLATPTWTDFTEVTPGGEYLTGGHQLSTNLVTMAIEAAGVLTFDSSDNPTWAQNASNPTTATWAILYNSTTGDALAFIELGGPIDMTAGPFTITWSDSGIFTIA